MTQKIIDLGQLPNGAGGDTNRSANVKCNENFTELYGKMAEKGANNDITALSGLTTVLSISQGGTNAKTVSGARANLDAAQKGNNSDITSLSGLNTALSVEQGGTGAKTSADACRNIGAVALGLYNDSYGTTLQNSAMPAIQFIAATTNAERGPLILTNGGNDSASCVFTFNRIGKFACYFGLDTDNQLKVGGWSMGQVAHRIYHQGNTTLTSDGTLKAI